MSDYDDHKHDHHSSSFFGGDRRRTARRESDPLVDPPGEEEEEEWKEVVDTKGRPFYFNTKTGETKWAEEEEEETLSRGPSGRAPPWGARGRGPGDLTAQNSIPRGLPDLEPATSPGEKPEQKKVSFLLSKEQQKQQDRQRMSQRLRQQEQQDRQRLRQQEQQDRQRLRQQEQQKWLHQWLDEQKTLEGVLGMKDNILRPQVLQSSDYENPKEIKKNKKWILRLLKGAERYYTHQLDQQYINRNRLNAQQLKKHQKIWDQTEEYRSPKRKLFNEIRECKGPCMIQPQQFPFNWDKTKVCSCYTGYSPWFGDYNNWKLCPPTLCRYSNKQGWAEDIDIDITKDDLDKEDYFNPRPEADRRRR